MSKDASPVPDEPVEPTTEPDDSAELEASEPGDEPAGPGETNTDSDEADKPAAPSGDEVEYSETPIADPLDEGLVSKAADNVDGEATPAEYETLNSGDELPAARRALEGL